MLLTADKEKHTLGLSTCTITALTFSLFHCCNEAKIVVKRP